MKLEGVLPMNIEQLFHIIEVYKTGSISKAAENCHVTIPGISQSISKLEKELDVIIFSRTRAGTTPTENGFHIIKKAHEIIASIEELKELSKSHLNLIQGKLSISASPSLIILLFKSISSFKKDYPKVEIKLTEKMAPEIIERIRQNRDDLGFTFGSPELLSDYETWEYETLFKERMYVCVNKNSVLASKNKVHPHELLNQKLVTYSGINLKNFVNEFIEKFGNIDIIFESNQIEIIKETVAEGLAISFLSGTLLKNDPRVINGEIVPLTINGFEKIAPFGSLRLRGTYFSPTAKEFLKYVKNQIKLENI